MIMTGILVISNNTIIMIDIAVIIAIVIIICRLLLCMLALMLAIYYGSRLIGFGVQGLRFGA